MYEEVLVPTPYFHKPPMRFKNYDIFYNRDYDLKKVVPNRHSYYEFYFLLSGNVTWHLEGRNYTVAEGDIFLVSPDQEHSLEINSIGNGPYERFVLFISSSYVDFLSSERTNLSNIFQTSCVANPHIRLTSDFLPHIKHLFNSIFINSKSQQYGADLLADAYITELLVHLAQSSCFNGIFDYHPLRSMSKDASLILKVLRYIDQHICESIHISDICAYFFVSRSYLSKQFTAEVGIPLYQYIIKKKLFLAKQDIADGLSFQEISQKYNFGNYSSFYKAFRTEFGQSPQKFKSEK